MLQALICGKLSRDHEQIEDILTSNVFGLLRYSDPRITLDFIERARLLNDKTPWDRSIFGSGELSIDWDFWPWWAEAQCAVCEPDVVLTLQSHGGARLLVLIEAKLHAGKSSLADPEGPPADQLAREWSNLVEKARASAAQPVLIYLTSHYSFPRADVEESVEEFRTKRDVEPTIAWLSWRELLPVLMAYPQNAITADISLLLERMDLTYFGGVTSITPVSISWRFGFDWNIGSLNIIDWSFS
jgi:hypothetical protein